MLRRLHNLDVSTETVFWYATLPTQSWRLNWNCVLICYAAYTILMSRLKLCFDMLCWLHNLDISTETVFCNVKLFTQSWYLDWDCILQCYSAQTILTYRMHLAMIFCLHHLDISTETVFAMLCCIHRLDFSMETVFCNTMLLIQSWYPDWDCLLQCYATYTI